jgi:radical SAM-linked protein
LQYTKYGKIRWIGHRDVARAMERAFRVAQLPLAFTEGFSPHPKVSFGLALSTGHESDGEYLDLVLADDVDLELLPALLTDALPDGMAVAAVVPLVDRAPALQEVVTAVVWQLEVTAADGTPVEVTELREFVDRTLASTTLIATRRRKGREVIEDVRPVVRHMRVDAGAVSASGADAVIEMELNTQPRSAKPDEVMAAAGDYTCVRALRTHQWIERDGARLEPLDADTRPRVPRARAS